MLAIICYVLAAVLAALKVAGIAAGVSWTLIIGIALTPIILALLVFAAVGLLVAIGLSVPKRRGYWGS